MILLSPVIRSGHVISMEVEMLRMYSIDRGGFTVMVVLSVLLLLPGCCGRPCEKEEVKRTDARNHWTFEQDVVGALPAGWQPAETRPQGHLATWQVVNDPTAPSPSRAVAITANANAGSTYNLLLATGTRFKNGTIKVRVKAVSGEEDQGGGPVWRALDRNNYYIARWNPLEDNFRVYTVRDGQRQQLGSATVKADATAWHTIEIVHQEGRIEALFDSQKLIELQDSTFKQEGMVGLWVKADGCTAFDDLTVLSR